MSRLSSRSRATQLRAYVSWLALAGLVASVGCSAAENDDKSTAQDRQTAQAASPSEQPTADRSAGDASAGDSVARKWPPSGNIPVNQDGYITFGESPEPAPTDESATAESLTEQSLSEERSPEEPAPEGPAREELSADRVQEATANAPAATELTAGKLKAETTEEQAADQTADTVAQPAAEPTGDLEAEEPSPAAPQSPSEELALSSEPTPAAQEDAAEATATVKAQTVSAEAQHSSASGLATHDERHQKIAEDWPKPQAVLFITGQQHGYIEPCGCTGLENQKGGLNRRDTLLKLLKERGWETVPMDVGNFERRVGRQAEIKFQTTVEALKDMQYRAATLGVDDLKLSSTHLLSLTATEGKTETPFISANAYILVEEYMPKSKIIEVGGRKIGVTAALGDSFHKELAASEDVLTTPAAESLRPVVKELKEAGCDYLVLLAHATDEESRQLAKDVPGFDLVVTAGGFPEPPFELEAIEGTDAKLAQVGAKGMYTVLIGLYPDSDQPVRYQRVALSSQFADSPRMLARFATYQKQLENLGFEGLGLRAATHPTGREFVGSEKCGECHTQAFEVWQNSKHFTATESLVKPPNDRGMIPRHHDPECLSCHVTGWNPQNYYPYATGFVSLKKTPMLTGSGCENCHGPGSAHVAAESGDVEADEALLAQLREQMRLPLAEARARCTECHDQDNSPDFQHEGAFEKYWEQIAHPGKD